MWIIIPVTIWVIGVALAMLPPATPEACPVKPAARPRASRLRTTPAPSSAAFDDEGVPVPQI